MSASLQDPRIAAGMRAQRDFRARYLREGAKQIGWKVGFGAPAAKEKLKIDMPVIGFLLDRAPTRVEGLKCNHVARIDDQRGLELAGKISVKRLRCRA